MKNYYTWSIHDKYARYWTKESIEEKEEFGPKFEIAKRHLAQTFDPHRLETWDPGIVKEAIEKDEGVLKRGDFHSTWGYGGHIVSQNMVDKIGDVLREYGDLFPLEVEGRGDRLYRYWVTREIQFVCVDKQKSRFVDNEYDENGTFKIEKLVLKEECETDAMIFRVSGEYKKTIFVSEDFIELVKKHNLKGFKFEIDSSYEYAVSNGSYILVG